MPTPLVETDWLASHLDDPDLRIVDARWRGDGSSRRLFHAGHVPDAVHLDWHLDLGYDDGTVQDLLLPPDRFAAVMGRAGIGDRTNVVAYADTDHSGAARLWWALRYYGHERVAVLNGGFTKWLAEGRPVTSEVTIPRPAVFTPRPQPALLATGDAVAAAIGDPRVRLVDTRPPEQYAGRAVWMPLGSLYLPADREWVEVDGRAIRGGRIPGAVSLPSTGNLDPSDWRFLPAEALRARAEAAGLDPEQPVITYCGVGISASLGLLALHLAGFRDVALYDASWAEWGTDPARPIERG